jgi:hypothetical protein
MGAIRPLNTSTFTDSNRPAASRHAKRAVLCHCDCGAPVAVEFYIGVISDPFFRVELGMGSGAAIICSKITIHNGRKEVFTLFG